MVVMLAVLEEVRVAEVREDEVDQVLHRVAGEHGVAEEGDHVSCLAA